MLKNFWKQIVVVCGNHQGEEILMDLKQGPSSLFYSCPKYYPENREDGEKACVNRINLVDFEKIVDILSEEVEKGLLNGQIVNLQNFTFKVKASEITVLEHTKGSIKIKILNKKALK